VSACGASSTGRLCRTEHIDRDKVLRLTRVLIGLHVQQLKAKHLRLYRHGIRAVESPCLVEISFTDAAFTLTTQTARSRTSRSRRATADGDALCEPIQSGAARERRSPDGPAAEVCAVYRGTVLRRNRVGAPGARISIAFIAFVRQRLGPSRSVMLLVIG
jgi:hypothetical protein